MDEEKLRRIEEQSARALEDQPDPEAPYYSALDVPDLVKEVRRCWAKIAELDKRDQLLTWLENGGVDNWEGYEISIENGREMDDD